MSGYKHITPAIASSVVTVVDYSQLTGVTLTVDDSVYTEGVDFTASTSNIITAQSLQEAIQGVQETTGVGATFEDNVVTLVSTNAVLTVVSSDPINLTTVTTAASDNLISSSSVNITLISAQAGSEAGVISLYNGTDATGVLVLSISCAANSSVVKKIKKGIRFASGCFVGFTSLPTSITIGYKKV